MATIGNAARPHRRIATEEAWISAELLALYQKMLKDGAANDPGFDSLWRHYGLGMSERCIAVRERMLDIGNRRIADMDAAGIDQYLDDQKFWLIFEAAEALNVPIYVHPNTPPPEMIGPLLARGLDGAIYGFAVECGMHLLTIIASGVFDRFPKLQMVFGHLGEGLPFWMFRLDFMHRAQVSTKRYECLKPLKRKISDYMRENVYYTTSGMAWAPAIMFTRAVVGADRVLYAMDYPYQFVPEEVAAMERMPLSEQDKKAFFQSNAESVFKL
jgi:predicted TIM-barrel fold metal-dependent hydrolase